MAQTPRRALTLCPHRTPRHLAAATRTGQSRAAASVAFDAARAASSTSASLRPSKSPLQIGEDLQHPTHAASPQQWAEQFLLERDPVRWTAPEGLPSSLSPAGLFTQPTRSGLDVVLAAADGRPSAADMCKGHKARRARRASPVLIAALYPSANGVSVSICGPVGYAPSVFADMDPAHVERIARLALATAGTAQRWSARHPRTECWSASTRRLGRHGAPLDAASRRAGTHAGERLGFGVHLRAPVIERWVQSAHHGDFMAPRRTAVRPAEPSRRVAPCEHHAPIGQGSQRAAQCAGN